ncbi:alpha/beta fold hydrolase [Streptomyces sp. NPDC020403]|uniref:alpha/beta fold hydrolase n=1 Tax=unclassified Streptomyces TaxID=2593676 RepID=UPI0033E5C817
MPTLAAHGYHVIAPDLRGTGASDRPPSGYRKDTQAEDMRELLAQLGIHGGVRIVGHDIGGVVAFAYARRHPEEVERLVLAELALPGAGHGRGLRRSVPLRPLHDRTTARDAPRRPGNDFLTRWFDPLSAVPGTFPPQEIATVASSHRGYEALRAGPGTKPEEPSPCPYSPSAASTAQTPGSPTV